MSYERKIHRRFGIAETYAELRRRIDELELDLLEVTARGVNHERLAEGDHALLGAGDGALEHQVVVLDDTVVREATHGCDGLLGNVRLGRRIVVGGTRANAVDLLVDLGTVVVSVCKSASGRAIIRSWLYAL